MNPITVNGNTYTSVAAAWREESPPGLTLAAVRWRLRHNWSPENAILLANVPPDRRRTFAAVRARITQDRR